MAVEHIPACTERACPMAMQLGQGRPSMTRPLYERGWRVHQSGQGCSAYPLKDERVMAIRVAE